ncbi:MAG TPA: hypothetical protein VF025_01455 [Gaiellaceae bacterium]
MSIAFIRRLALGGAALATLVLAPGAGAAPTATVTISHQTRGCHSWAFASGPVRSSLSVTVSAGTMLRFRNDDLMPHTLIQTAGPKLHLVHPSMKGMASTAWTTLAQKGVYRFTTKAGEDYPSAGSVHTTGEDHVLRLTVRVK